MAAEHQFDYQSAEAVAQQMDHRIRQATDKIGQGIGVVGWALAQGGVRKAVANKVCGSQPPGQWPHLEAGHPDSVDQDHRRLVFFVIGMPFGLVVHD